MADAAKQPSTADWEQTVLRMFTNAADCVAKNADELKNFFQVPSKAATQKGATQKGARKRKVTDTGPDATNPQSKRAKSGYLVYADSIRASVKASSPGIGPADVMREIARRWSALQPDEKNRFNTQATILAQEASGAQVQQQPKAATPARSPAANPAATRPTNVLGVSPAAEPEVLEASGDESNDSERKKKKKEKKAKKEKKKKEKRES